MPIQKWKKIKSEREYDGQRIKIRRDFLVLPDGKEIDFTVLERGKVVAILPITKNNEVVVIKQYRPSVDDITLDIPGGGIHTRENENPKDAARRELKEETGFDSENISELGVFYPDSGRSEQVRHIFVAEDLIPGEQELDKTEFIEVEKIPLDKLKQNIIGGKIKEPTLCLAVLLHVSKQASLNKSS